MSETPSARPFRRILVALDATQESLAALEVAALLAQGLESELAGLFIEDQDLLQVAALPFTREVALPGRGGGLGFDAASLEGQLQAKAAAARRAMEMYARRCRVSWSFQVVRGRAEGLIVEAAADSDIIALGKWLGALSRQARLECAARVAAARAYGAALFMGRSGRFRPGPVIAVFDGGEGSVAALDAAAQIAGTLDQPLAVELFAAADAGAEALRAKAEKRLAGHGAPVRLTPARGAGVLLADLAAAQRGLIVVPTETAAALCERFEDILEAVRCPVLMMGRGTGGA